MTDETPDTPGAPDTPEGEEAKAGRSPWLWVSLALMAVVIALLIWGLGRSQISTIRNNRPKRFRDR